MKKKTLCCVLFFVALLLAALTGCADLNVNFVIAFESNGGTPCEEIRSQDAASIRIPDDPVRENYVFAGWYWDDGVWEEPFTLNSLLDVPVSERMEIVVYAKWEGAEYNVVLKVGEEEMRTVPLPPFRAAAIRIGSAHICGISDSRSFQRLGGSARQSSGKQGNAIPTGICQEESSKAGSFQRSISVPAANASIGAIGVTDARFHASRQDSVERDGSPRHFQCAGVESATPPHSPRRRNAGEK